MGDYTFKECELMIKIAVRELPENLTLTALAKEIDTVSSSPTFVSVINTLKENNLLEVHDYIGNVKLIKINEKKLRDFIDELPITNFFFEYFKIYHIVSW